VSGASPLWQFSLHAAQALLWLAALAAVFWLGLRVSWTRLIGFTAFLTLDLIMFGAFVRLSDSGLGCPDWPGCYAQAAPLFAKGEIAAAVALQGGEQGWVSHTKAWIEMIHRYWASFIGVLIIVILVRAIRARRSGEPVSLALPWLLLATVLVQGLFGKWTVTFKLMPAVVTLHLLLGLTLFAQLVWLALRQTYRIDRVAVPPALHWHAVAALAVLALQIALGGWVSTNYAALACGDGFPACLGSAWPPMDFANGFDLTRDMGRVDSGATISLQALTAVHYVHRAFALVVLLVLGALAWRVARRPALRRWGAALGAALLAQLAIGIGTVVFQQPLLLAVAHNGAAAVLLGVLVALTYKIRPLPQLRAAPAWNASHRSQTS
jgi:cytochrome c oxidase assembly protein subunit 15